MPRLGPQSVTGRDSVGIRSLVGSPPTGAPHANADTTGFALGVAAGMVADVLLVRNRFDERFNDGAGVGEHSSEAAAIPVFASTEQRDRTGGSRRNAAARARRPA